ncbi:MAG: hypothetical protein KBS79_03475 [Lachnospiraceae bacterium]|nr:hypothetical protein [Candidatus Minthocola equi]
MIYTTQTLSDKLQSYSDPLGKIMRMTQKGELYTLTRGLYESDRSTPGHYLAPAIYGPSYLSFDYALSHYGLIPEAVYTYTSATFDKKKSKEYINSFGRYTYCDVPKACYSFGVRVVEENGYSYMIATPEKALCDKLYSVSPVKSLKELENLLFFDLRIDRFAFEQLNKRDLSELCDLYHSNNMRYLKKLIGGEK